MRVVMRVDASLEIGSGHVMRCLTLADELRSRGAEVHFICRDHPGNLVALIAERGYSYVGLETPTSGYLAPAGDTNHAAWLAVSWQQDAEETVAALPSGGVDWLVIDHYALDRRWEERLRPHVGKIMVIDDLADRPHACDLLLDQNLYRDLELRYNDLVPAACQRLLGPRYALLRSEFALARKQLRQRDGQVRRILVFFGGVDPANETSKALQALIAVNLQGVAVDVVVGGGNPHKDEIEALCVINGFSYNCQVSNMAELMAAADLAIGGGGTATWERCAVGLPSLVMVLADNQRELAHYGAQSGLCLSLGDASDVSPDEIGTAVSFVLRSPDTLRHLVEQCLATVDARGCSRVATLLLPPQIVIRRAVLDDCDAIHEWRNAEETRRYIFDAAPIPLEIHRQWYRKTLDNPNRVLLIGELDGKPIGVLRYDLTDNEALISVYLVPGTQGQGIGSELIRSGSRWLRQQYPRIATVKAEIFRENVASLRAFEAAGYNEHHLVFHDCLHE